MLKDELLRHATELRIKSEQIYALVAKFDREGFDWLEIDENQLEVIKSLPQLEYFNPSKKLLMFIRNQFGYTYLKQRFFEDNKT